MRHLTLLGCGIVALGLSACGASHIKTYPVEGKVVFKGKGKSIHKLAGGRVRFRSMSDADVVGVAAIEEDGKFSVGSFHKEKDLPGLPAGDYQARIEPPRQDDDDDARPRRVVNPRHLDYDRSGFRITVPMASELVLEVEP